MNVGSQLRIEAAALAKQMLAKVAKLPSAGMRAAALASGLNAIRPGLSSKVQAHTETLIKKGFVPAQALQTALTYCTSSVIWDSLETSGGLSGCMGCDGLGDWTDVLSSVTEAVGSAFEVGVGVYGLTQAEHARRQADRAARRDREAAAVQPAPLPPSTYLPAQPAADGISTPLMVGGGVLAVGGIIAAIVLTRKPKK